MSTHKKLRKFRFTGDARMLPGGTFVHRIEALIDIPCCGIEAGDIGGWLEQESNLSHDGTAWVTSDAQVYEDARVEEDALILGSACVYGSAMVRGHGSVGGHAQVYRNAHISGNAMIYDDAKVYGFAHVYGDAEVYGEAEVHDNAWVYDNAQISGHAKVHKRAEVCGNAHISGNVRITKLGDYAVLRNFWSSGRPLTYTRPNKMWRAGCFYGTGEELIAKAYKDSRLSGKCYEAMVRFIDSAYASIDNAGGKMHRYRQ